MQRKPRRTASVLARMALAVQQTQATAHICRNTRARRQQERKRPNRIAGPVIRVKRLGPVRLGVRGHRKNNRQRHRQTRIVGSIHIAQVDHPVVCAAANNKQLLRRNRVDREPTKPRKIRVAHKQPIAPRGRNNTDLRLAQRLRNMRSSKLIAGRLEQCTVRISALRNHCGQPIALSKQRCNPRMQMSRRRRRRRARRKRCGAMLVRRRRRRRRRRRSEQRTHSVHRHWEWHIGHPLVELGPERTVHARRGSKEDLLARLAADQQSRAAVHLEHKHLHGRARLLFEHKIHPEKRQRLCGHTEARRFGRGTGNAVKVLVIKRMIELQTRFLPRNHVHVTRRKTDHGIAH
eukprot:comp24423_c0_seq1/m.60257 comp24423_c0_seq1/g.60257  ORF comp24423_c0_seq1/g.60257 comp24423_c0_seq1/m.60257 type:complete len:348 (-) comp24423_c0_seq1:1133-2176(-)